MWRPLFLLGNKRSGTTHLTRLLNAHPRIYLPPEADLVWALYCRAYNLALQPYKDDGPRGFARTLSCCGDALADPHASTAEVFARMLGIYARFDGKNLDEMAWAGDKKPVQHADPELFSFIRATWPQARFLHIIRHPAAVVASKREALAGYLSFMKIWDKPDAELLAFWTRNEERVLAHKAAGAPILSLTLPALVHDPARAMARIFAHLELPDDPAALAFAQSLTTTQDEKYESRTLPLTPDARAIIAHYRLDAPAAAPPL